MSGHSKWSTIKRKKGALDAKRGKIFSRLAKEITIAAKLGGGEPDMNPRLRTALNAAKSNNMPKDNIDRAIKKGTGEIEGVSYEEVRYECYAPGGVALIVETLTDNKNRTVGEVRHAVTKAGGAMAESGAVIWNFDAKGQITGPAEGKEEEALFEIAIESGAEDVYLDDDYFTVMTDPGDLHAVSSALESAGLNIEEATLVMVPKTTVAVEGKTAEQVLRTIEVLEENEDVQNVFGNFDISDEEMAALAG